MYDILQLNDMLVPELHDIADQLKIPNSKKLNKQDLIYQILDSQAIAGSKDSKEDKPKRRRIVKTTTAIGSEEAFVEDEGKPEAEEKVVKAPAKKTKAPAKKKKAGDDETAGEAEVTVAEQPKPKKPVKKETPASLEGAEAESEGSGSEF